MDETEPRAGRPYMPSYGIDETTATLLPWSWAIERLTGSHEYWLATRWPDGRPHLMPVWAVWRTGGLWFSSSVTSRKARNLRDDPRCSLATDDPLEPVMVEGTVEVVTDMERISSFLAASNLKYGVDYGIDFLEPSKNATFYLRPSVAFGFTEEDFTATPTRWSFD